MDSRGNLYGTTEQGGTLGDGTVFELSPPSTSGALSRFALAGNPEAWIARIEEIAHAGATKLWLNAEGGNLDRQFHYMRLLGEKIMSRFV